VGCAEEIWFVAERKVDSEAQQYEEDAGEPRKLISAAAATVGLRSRLF
jgi:hypothetical protein